MVYYVFDENIHFTNVNKKFVIIINHMIHGLVVIVLAWQSRDPGSNLAGGKYFFFTFLLFCWGKIKWLEQDFRFARSFFNLSVKI